MRNGSLIAGFRCMGKYCDNIGVGWEIVPGSPPLNFLWNHWTPYFSEESPNARECAPGYWMTGVSCQHDYCDNISIQCSATVSRQRGECKWMEGQFSEEGGGYQVLDPGWYAIGLACFGSYCDNMNVKECKVAP